MAVSMRARVQRALSVAVLGLLLAGAAVPGAPAARAERMAAACPAVGIYTVGGPLPAAQGSGGANGPAALLPGYLGALRGTLTISAYTGCGAPTAGTFVVQGLMRPIIGAQPGPGGGQSKGAQIMPLYGGTGILTATGTIAQDGTHQGDPTYVAVAATVIYGRYNLGCPPLCTENSRAPQACPVTGCIYRAAVTRTAAFGSITGFLRLQLGARPMAGLAFLPPPDPAVSNPAAAMQIAPMSIIGYRAGP